MYNYHGHEMKESNVTETGMSRSARVMTSWEQRSKVGQLFVVGFHSTTIDDNIRTLICNYGVGGIVLFKRNIESAEQLRELCLDLQRTAKEAGHMRPLFIGIDQENGLVTRISPPIATQLPGPMALAANGNPEYAERAGSLTGEMLSSFGINMNYAPVADVNSEPLNPVIGTRSPGDNPHQVAQFSRAFAKGLRDQNIVPCAKHFPGHGDTAVDSHYGLPVINKTRAELEETELIPFKDLAWSEPIEMIMTAHISLPQVLGSPIPATLSAKAVDILRSEWGYDGVIISDCLEMDGIRARYGTIEGAAMAIEAGVDSVMICHTFEVQTKAIDRICELYVQGSKAAEAIDKSLARVGRLKERNLMSWDEVLDPSPTTSLGSINDDTKAFADEAYASSVTLVRAASSDLPLNADQRTIFLSPGPNIPSGGAVDSGEDHPSASQPTRVPWTASTFVDELRKYNPSIETIRFADAHLTDDQWANIQDADVVIVATRNAKESPYQAELGREVTRRRKGMFEKKTVFIATCNPYDFWDEEDVAKTYLCTYEPTVEAFRAVVDVLYGAKPARGKLPVVHKTKSK